MSAAGRAFKDALDAMRRGADDLHVRLDTGVTRKIDTHVTRTNSDVDVLDANTVDLDAPTVHHTNRFDGGGSGGSGAPGERRRGVDRGDGRDDYGHFVGSDTRPWTDKEGQGLDEVEADLGLPVMRDQVNASVEGLDRPGTSTPQVRRYDGLVQNADGSWTGIEVKSGSARRNPAQLLFDTTVSPETPAIAQLNGSEIRIVRVILQEVP